MTALARLQRRWSAASVRQHHLDRLPRLGLGPAAVGAVQEPQLRLRARLGAAALMEQEQRFLAMLQAVAYWERRDEVLLLLDGEGRQRIRLIRMSS